MTKRKVPVDNSKTVLKSNLLTLAAHLKIVLKFNLLDLLMSDGSMKSKDLLLVNLLLNTKADKLITFLKNKLNLLRRIIKQLT
jgi:hypothetical protein